MEHKQMTKKEIAADVKAFKSRPEQVERIKAEKKAHRHAIKHGLKEITKGPNAGLKKGTGTQKWKKEDLHKAHAHMKAHGG